MPSSIDADQLMTHMRVFCQQIGARPTGSAAERRAGEYVRDVLAACNLVDTRRQPFATYPSSGSAALPVTVSAALGALVAERGRFGKLLGGLALLNGALNLLRLEGGLPAAFQTLIATVESQNIIARIPPSGETKRAITIVAHLDSNKQRFLFPLPIPPLTRAFHTLSTGIAALGGISMLLDALTGTRRVNGLQKLARWATLLGTASLIIDEFQPFVEGANDNATALSVALGLAETLSAAPLANTEVILLFTGSEETGCVGIAAYLDQYAPPLTNTYFIDIEMVGTGNLCYITEHGINQFVTYTPAPRITAQAAAVARAHPELGVTGKRMTIVEEVAILRARGYEALCVAGYGADGMLPNWHRVTDTLDNIEPDTLQRAARYIYALMQALDRQ